MRDSVNSLRGCYWYVFEGRCEGMMMRCWLKGSGSGFWVLVGGLLALWGSLGWISSFACGDGD